MQVPGVTYKCKCQGPCKCRAKGTAVYTAPGFMQETDAPPGCVGPNCPSETRPTASQ
ncbi:hypothetical protein GMRT_12424 [Giardia muris]|uniref:Uncharacterized protein n=1 Tax=Giardia muris TaxID=5742 RepID=A0A4Z1SUD3_GIAMU|nr:hypothetical protein GMRT_12424 [Giardia muris]|eukprot:TNJ27218.1 hypothetical protein GMRT_12424 [Giardia muris]